MSGLSLDLNEFGSIVKSRVKKCKPPKKKPEKKPLKKKAEPKVKVKYVYTRSDAEKYIRDYRDLFNNNQETSRPKRAVRKILVNEFGLNYCNYCKQLCESGNFRFNYSVKCRSCYIEKYTKDPKRWFVRHTYKICKSRAKVSGTLFTITEKDILDKLEEQKDLCAACGRPITFAKNWEPTRKKCRDRPFLPNAMNLSLDQIVPSAGYTKENLQLLNVSCNLSKLEFPMEDFLEMCRCVTKHHSPINVEL